VKVVLEQKKRGWFSLGWVDMSGFKGAQSRLESTYLILSGRRLSRAQDDSNSILNRLC
jgi:hypothetical protein